MYPLIGCGHCERCLAGEDNLCAEWRLIGMHRPGVFAEQVAVPRAALVPVPDDTPSERAVLTAPLACALGALRPYDIGAGSAVAILGCGPIGLLAITLAASRGADVTAVDPLAERQAVARSLGAARAVASHEGLQGGMSLVVDAAGFASSWRAALDLARGGGDIVMLGLGEAEGPFPMAQLVRRGIRLRGHFAYSRAEFAESLRLLADDLDVGDQAGWLSLAPFERGAQAFEHLVHEPGSYIKIILETEQRPVCG